MDIKNIRNDSNVATPSETGKVPQISIGMPVYNGTKFIREALDSLLVQTFTDFELIISDNTSTDATEAICREYAAKDERIRYVRQAKNLGLVANFKFVLDESVGEYFMWAAHDDRWHCLFIEECLRVFEDDPKCDLVFSEYIVKNLVDGTVVRHRSAISNSSNPRTNYITRLMNPNPSLTYGVHRKSCILNFGIGNYDYADLHLTHLYALNSIIKILPYCYFITGTTGQKGLYSMTGRKYISPKVYLKNERHLLYSKFGFFEATLLFALCSYICLKNTIAFNSLIKFRMKSLST
jgi:glycosyltransferase involved in cell wall biosynthesis